MGGWQHLEAILFLLNEALTEEWEYVHIISGEDYPLFTREDFDNFFYSNRKIYLNHQLITKKIAYTRYAYKWPYTKFGWNYKNKLIRYIDLAFVGAQKVFKLDQEGIGDFILGQIYWGFVWGSFPKDSVIYLLEYLGNHKKFVNDIQWCKIPEELCFHTILMNNSNFAERICNDNLRFWDMSRGDNWGPVYLDEKNLDDIKESKKAFARKVKDNIVGDYLYNQRLKNNNIGNES